MTKPKVSSRIQIILLPIRREPIYYTEEWTSRPWSRISTRWWPSPPTWTPAVFEFVCTLSVHVLVLCILISIYLHFLSSHVSMSYLFWCPPGLVFLQVLAELFFCAFMSSLPSMFVFSYSHVGLTVCEIQRKALQNLHNLVYGESCAVLRHNCLCIVTLLLSWDCPFKRLFSSRKYIYICLTIFSPLKELHYFTKCVKT